MLRALYRRLMPLLVILLLSAPIPLNGSVTLASAQGAGEVVTVGPRGDAGLTGSMPGQGPVTEPDIVWQASSNDGVIMGMAISGDALFFATKDPGTVTAVDRGNGGIAWTVDLGVESTVFGPEVAGDLVVVGVWAEGANGIVALDGATGVERWRFATDNLPTAPTFANGAVYVAAEGGLDADSSLYALDAASGTQKWIFDAPEALDLGERIAVADGIVVASAWSLQDNGVGAYALDAATGQQLWTFTETDELNADPVVGYGTVLITDLPTTWALDLRTGAIRWEHHGASTGGGQAMDANAAYLSYGDELQAVSLADGSLLWTAPVSGIAGPPTIASGVVYTAVWKPSDEPANHWIHAFDAASGAEVWSLELEHRVSGNQPLADDGVLYVDTDSDVVAFGSAGMVPQGPSQPPLAVSTGGEYTSPEFGYTITWMAPWERSEPRSSSDPGQDFVTLLTGDASLAIRASSGISSQEQLVAFYASQIQSSHPEAQVAVSNDSPELSRATARYSIDSVAHVEYVEVRPLPDGSGVVLTILTGPADWFPLAFQAAQHLVAIDQQPPFRSTPTGTDG